MSVEPFRRWQRYLVRCRAGPEREKLTAESESLKGSKRADERKPKAGAC